jgi:glycosyltransferase involved in cell wall biosynthesis
MTMLPRSVSKGRQFESDAHAARGRGMADTRPLSIGVFGVRGVPSTYSGYETFLTAMLPLLVGRGHTVTVYCRSREPEQLGDMYRGVRLVSTGSIGTKQLDTLTHGVSAALRARRRHDVVLVCNVANAPVVSIMRLLRVPSVLNLDGQEWLRGKWGRVGRTWFKSSARLSRYASSALVSDCRAMQKIYAESFGAISTVIPYSLPESVAVANELTTKERNAILELYQLEADKFFLTGGRMVPENNIDFVVEAYHSSSRPEPLVVVGRANYDSPVVQRINEIAAVDRRIRVLGHVDNRLHFGALLRAAIAYTHGHSVGGMNPSLIEAMGVGAMVVALDTEFNREVLADTGVFFDKCSNSLQYALDAATGGDSLRLRESAVLRAKSEYSIEDVTDAYERLLIASAGSPWKTVRLETKWFSVDHV